MPDRDGFPSSPFVSTDWLMARLHAPEVISVDGSWFLPTQGRNGAAEFTEAHIPGAVFFDIDTIADPSNGLPHMLPSAEAFADAAGALGLSEDRTLVVYDGMGLFSAPRVWWTLRRFGARDVRILDGGFPKWQAEGKPVESGLSRRAAAHFEARPDHDRVATLASVRAALQARSAQVIDARPAARFKGEAPEPRPGLSSGHMPGSLNVPFSDLVEDGRLKSPDRLRPLFEQAGVALDHPVITSCGSGVSAAILVLALDILGRPDASLYDGSWAEYGASGAPVATGP